MNTATASYPFDLGNWSREITTSSREAQQWFDRGLNWTYGYNQEEAVTCFRHALTYDPDCAMAHWGVALAIGPFYNRPWIRFSDPEILSTLPQCYAAAQSALAQSERCTPVEKALIEAITHRYRDAETLDRDVLDSWHADYVNQMRKVHATYQCDPDVAALFAEAAVTRTPRQLWNMQTGDPMETSDIVEAEKVLNDAIALCAEKGIVHLGLAHMQIHAYEMSHTPEAALQSADGLRKLAPDAGHLEHMPAHIYVLLGDYMQAVRQSEYAIEADDRYLAHVGAKNFYTTARCHDFHLLMYSAMFLGHFGKAMGAADRILAEATPELIAWAPPFMGSILDGYSAMRIHVLVRFGKWETLAAISEFPDPAVTPIRAAMLAYGQVVANAALGNFETADAARQRFLTTYDGIPADDIFLSNPIKKMLDVGHAMMEGELAYHKGEYEVGFAHLREAVARDDALNYTEPWAWMHPPRHALGALLSEQGQYEEATHVFREDLGLVKGVARCSQHPENIWALRGLYDCILKTGTPEEATDLQARLNEVQKHADQTISAACCCTNHAGSLTK